MHTEEHFVRNEKFRLIQAVSAMLHAAPPPVRRAWRNGWNNIKFYPKGYSSMDSCGCCGTDYPAGWYGHSTETIPLMSICKEPFRKWRFICDPGGGQEYNPSSWTLTG